MCAIARTCASSGRGCSAASAGSSSSSAAACTRWTCSTSRATSSISKSTKCSRSSDGRSTCHRPASARGAAQRRVRGLRSRAAARRPLRNPRAGLPGPRLSGAGAARAAADRRGAAGARLLPWRRARAGARRDRSAHVDLAHARDPGRRAHRPRLDHGVSRRRSACSSSAAACCRTRRSSRASWAFPPSSRVPGLTRVAARRRLGRDRRQHRRRSASRHRRRMRSEAAARADFSAIRYAQVWEDADVLLAALDVQPGDVCVSIASAGDNALALLTSRPARVVALDLSPAQLACLELRVAAYRDAHHRELLELIGSRPSARRARAVRALPAGAGRRGPRVLGPPAARRSKRGIGSAGKFERYFALFRKRVLPLVHRRRTVARACCSREPRGQAAAFYDGRWDTWRWRLLFRAVLLAHASWAGWAAIRSSSATSKGTSPRRSSSAPARADGAGSGRQPLRALDPDRHARRGAALRAARRSIRHDPRPPRSPRVALRVGRGVPRTFRPSAFDRFNLSDLFEYVSVEHYHRMLESILAAQPTRRPARVLEHAGAATAPGALAARLRPLDDLGRVACISRDRAFFYSAFRVEEVDVSGHVVPVLSRQHVARDRDGARRVPAALRCAAGLRAR